MRYNAWGGEPIGNPHITRKVQKGMPQRYYEPSTTFLLVSGLVLSAIGTITSVIGAISQGAQAKKAAKARSDIALRNAMVARANAAFDAEQARKVKHRRLGAIKAAGGASGIQFAGSVIDIFQSSIIEANIELDNIRRKGELIAQGFQDESRLQLVSGENAQTSSFFDAGGAVVSGLSSVADSFSSAKRLSLLQQIAEDKT